MSDRAVMLVLQRSRISVLAIGDGGEKFCLAIVTERRIAHGQRMAAGKPRAGEGMPGIRLSGSVYRRWAALLALMSAT